MVKQEACLCIFRKKIPKTHHFNMHCRWTGKNRLQTYIWVDVKMLTNYAYFGDVVSFDTTFGTNKESRPFDVFVGFNHFKETVVFGAVLMYNETFNLSSGYLRFS
jgi:zinc finger SWIM domain-containing protein 3